MMVTVAVALGAGVLFFWRESCTSFVHDKILRLREFRGLAPKSFWGGAGSPKSPDHGDNPPLAPPLRVVFPPPIN